MRKIMLVFCLVFLIGNCLADCDNSQIDINSASLEELDEIIWVGPATAEKIIDARPFDDVDNLIKVSGIGEVKLGDIKDQDLACVEDGKKRKKDKEKIVYEEASSVQNLDLIGQDVGKEIKTGEMISLIPKDIKKDVVKENTGKGSYAMYGLVAFSVLLLFLFALKIKGFRKDELE